MTRPDPERFRNPRQAAVWPSAHLWAPLYRHVGPGERRSGRRVTPWRPGTGDRGWYSPGIAVATIDFAELYPSAELREALEMIAANLPMDWRITFNQHPSPGAFLELTVSEPSPPVYPKDPKWLLPPLEMEGALIPLRKLERAWQRFLEVEASEVFEAWRDRLDAAAVNKRG